MYLARNYQPGTRVATVRETSGENENFSRSGKSQKSGKIFDIVKVIEKSGNSIFRFIVHKFSSRLKKCIFFRERWKVCCKAISLTLRLTYVVVVVIDFRCECFLPNPFFYPRKKRKEVENEEKNIDAYKKS